MDQMTGQLALPDGAGDLKAGADEDAVRPADVDLLDGLVIDP
jgi:hypothetical protein